MSKRCRYKNNCNRSCGFDPCRVALFLLVLNRAGIISPNTGIILVLLFLLCCSGCRPQGICCGR
ncbi:hypothetical protein SH2C18_32910 [Clostridium sediminicola]|uniref:hypothetical protein n=1 Tax=Clostridium sediminicola TaxID=3114879 RepID=UPI0031F270EA